ncbi:hypothetical protein [Chitinophaga pinensis]|uniref:6-phosphogluconate dehydrogenase n=1 Tax=Chitinophaga pinensis (strain ATCC 43595 / DSM 2588 / LMG 13176 / NBRC 15968 / NCIMB 11800 / UQM 2034) TaxID=485918 RepID=A0A979G0Q3_CHIPD|nr:hypothetical protein [Chitinophaga pinensis]ACU58689.1 hypothetical protein Cpin_1191 [Chitinophaga pinensis DSM 2588]
MRRFLFMVVGGVLLALVVFFLYKYYFVFGRGVKAGELNYFVEKGYVFKTYEGRLIQSGYRSKQPGALQSNEFQFSVADERIAQQLMTASGKFVELHYKEYLGAVPWRGFSNFIVDSVITVRDVNY